LPDTVIGTAVGVLFGLAIAGVMLPFIAFIGRTQGAQGSVQRAI
jgi:hypothetical protein